MASTDQACHKGNMGVRAHQQPYKYEPLEIPSNIRILELFVYNDQLECRLRQINVMDGGYQALSYFWGSGGSPFQVTVRGANGNDLGYIDLTANLHNALHDIWSAKDIDRKIFWIDQICINQRGGEKNGQVALMRQIYSRADGVVTYLGPAADEIEHKRCCELLLETHLSFLRNYDRYFEIARLETILLYRHTLPTMELAPEIERKFTKQNWKWLSEVATAEWHTRLWIVQEQLLNGNIIMLYGNQTLLWDAVVMLPVHAHVGVLNSEDFVRLERKQEQFFHAPHMLDMWLQRQRHFFRHDATSATFDQLPTLLYNVKAHFSLQCTDLRDHVYALLAVSSDTAELGLVPDYSQQNSIRQLCTDLTIRVLQNDRNLLALQYVNSWHGPDGLTKPSWAVDIVQCNEGPRHSLRWDNNAAHPRTLFSSVPKFDPEKQTLTIRGQILDTVDLVVVSFSKYESHHLGDEYFATALDHICKVARLLLVFGSDLVTTALFCRVLVGGARALSGHIEDGDITENQAFHLWSWLYCQIRNINEDLRAILDKRTDSWSLTSFQKELLNTAPQYSHAYSTGQKNEAFGRFSREVNLDGRSVCRTAKNRMGNVPDTTEKKDVIAAFEGGNLLYILRPNGETYRFVGTAYIEGVMNGEAYRSSEIDQTDHDIVLM